MSFHEVQPYAHDDITDPDRAAMIKYHLAQCSKHCRRAVTRVNQLVANAPGGKAALVAELGADAQLIVDVLADYATNANTPDLKAGRTLDVTPGLVQGDLP